ncbi:DUF6275 family protein [Massilimicrobiota sp. An80]|uniref:DUF6275 family protein n=1 Tax=Massilimicrobiota sp. An80 TaxID=1965658 RepID=UPI001EF698E6|nr:DUF6275 family protein [Massilimicrobiota sp. An80]
MFISSTERGLQCSSFLHEGWCQARLSNYELTYNGCKKELYLDAYKKFENKCIEIQ